MTPSEIGNLAQSLFEKTWKSVYEKEAYLHRFVDTTDIRARFQGKTIAHLPAQPADYHVTVVGEVAHYAEVKGTANKTSFSFSSLEKSQLAAMKQVTKAGGQYWVYIYSVVYNLWYRIPAAYILEGVLTTFNFDKHGREFEWPIGNFYGRK